MRTSGRCCALALVMAVAGGLLAAGPAAADTPEAFAGTAAARALNLQVLGLKVTAGATTALANSVPKAAATGAGLALIAGTQSTATADGPNASQAPPEACALNIPLGGLLNVAVACSKSAASTTNAAPTASSSANVAAIDIGVIDLVVDLLQPILDALIPVADQVIGQVTGTIRPVLGSLLDPLLGGLGLDLDSPVQSLVDALENVTKLASVRVGDSTSDVVTADGAVTALSTAKGAQVDVLPGLTAAGGPLLSITVGSASTKSTFDRGTGKSTATFDPALLTLKVLGATVPVGLGQPITLFAGTVLESTISVGAGRTVENPDGTVGAVADGLSIQLLKGLGGGIILELAHAESAVGGAKAVITAQALAASAAAPKPILARTGGQDEPLLPLGFLLIVAAFVTRRLVVRVRA